MSRTWKQIAGVLGPCCLVAGCTSVPELPAVNATHPAHPDAHAAPLVDRPSVLDLPGLEVVPADDMAGEEMDHSHMMMDMDDKKKDPPEDADAGEEMDHSHMMMDMDDKKKDPPEHADAGKEMDHSHRMMDMDGKKKDPPVDADDGENSAHAHQGGDDAS